MSDQQPRFTVVPFVPKPKTDAERDMQANVVAMLRDLLARAEAGEIEAVAGCMQTTEAFESFRATDSVNNAVKLCAIGLHNFNEVLRT